MEWSQLLRIVHRTEGTPAGVAIIGDPGVGKTRLLARLREAVRRDGRRTIVGRPDRPVMAFTEVNGAVPWERLADLIEAAPAGTVVILDDLHQLRPAPGTLLQRIIGAALTTPLTLVVAYRPRQLEPCLAGVLAGEVASRILDVLRLGPLDRAGIRELAAELTGSDPADAEALHIASGGNPQYLRLLLDPSAEAASPLLGELTGLTREQLDVAYAAAALGEPFTPDLLVAISPRDRTTTLEGVDALAAADLIRVADRPALLEFRHPAVARVIYENAPPTARRAAHARIEAALAEAGAELARRERLLSPRGPIAALTAREQEIATLASSGISSNAMALRLHLSVRTVDTHLGRIYRKLRVNGRVALASMVLTNGPVPSDVEPE